MKKYTILILIILTIHIISLDAIPKPKSSEVGAIIGNARMQFTTNINTIKAGTKVNAITIEIMNVDTGKRYRKITDPDGFFMFLNLKPGVYALKRYSKSINIHVGEAVQTYTFKSDFPGPPEIEVKPGEIQVLSTYLIKFSDSRVVEKQMQGSPLYGGNTEKTSYSILIKIDVIDETDETIDDFLDWDCPLYKWKDFNFTIIQKPSLYREGFKEK